MFATGDTGGVGCSTKTGVGNREKRQEIRIHCGGKEDAEDVGYLARIAVAGWIPIAAACE